MNMEKTRILVVDDEQDICDIISFNLQTAGYEVETAASAEEAMDKGIQRFQLILLDVMMPGMSGLEMARQIKARTDTAHIPLIFLSAKDTEDDIISGFETGADDYVPKPFSVRELLARVKAVLARIPNGEKRQQEVVDIEGLVIDLKNMRVIIDGEDAALTRTEYELLRILATNRQQVLSRQQLIEKAWPKGVVVSDRTVDVNIARMRKKIGRFSSFIISRSGFGYCFEV